MAGGDGDEVLVGPGDGVGVRRSGHESGGLEARRHRICKVAVGDLGIGGKKFCDEEKKKKLEGGEVRRIESR